MYTLIKEKTCKIRTSPAKNMPTNTAPPIDETNAFILPKWYRFLTIKILITRKDIPNIIIKYTKGKKIANTLTISRIKK
jgi:hypothetical protein